VHFIDDEKAKLALEGKTQLLRLMQEYEVSQDRLALAVGGIDRSLISRMLNPQTDIFPDIFLLSNGLTSNDEVIEMMMAEYLDWLEGFAGRQASALKTKYPPDGRLDDELQDLAIAQGKFAEALKQNKIEPAEKIAKTVQEIASRMMAEVADFRKRQAKG
jgi:hypothetical protein